MRKLLKTKFIFSLMTMCFVMFAIFGIKASSAVVSTGTYKIKNVGGGYLCYNPGNNEWFLTTSASKINIVHEGRGDFGEDFYTIGINYGRNRGIDYYESSDDYMILGTNIRQQYFNGEQVVGFNFYNGTPNLHWTITPAGLNKFRMINRDSNLNLDSHPLGNGRFGAIHQWQNLQAPQQIWYLERLISY